ncbi:golgin subfamily A member 4-like [Rhopilema esculentum]|uniref:golgin subfamily A member 4-like n=1 Tax=Rhopilema esculentum TaxID=499914 RepID=UPI0031D8F1A1|eukprot:gene8036-13950_t
MKRSVFSRLKIGKDHLKDQVMPKDYPCELQATDFPPVESDLERSTEKKCAQPAPRSQNSSHCSYEDLFGKGIDELKRKGSLREWRLFVLSRELAKYEREKANQRKENKEKDGGLGESNTKVSVTKAKSRVWSIEEEIGKLIQSEAGCDFDTEKDVETFNQCEVDRCCGVNVSATNAARFDASSDKECCQGCQCQFLESTINEIWIATASFKREIETLKGFLSADFESTETRFAGSGSIYIQEGLGEDADRPSCDKKETAVTFGSSLPKADIDDDENNAEVLLKLMHQQLRVLEKIFRCNSNLLLQESKDMEVGMELPKQNAQFREQSKGTSCDYGCSKPVDRDQESHFNDINSLKEKVRRLEDICSKLEKQSSQKERVSSRRCDESSENKEVIECSVTLVLALVRMILENILLKMKEGKQFDATAVLIEILSKRSLDRNDVSEEPNIESRHYQNTSTRREISFDKVADILEASDLIFEVDRKGAVANMEEEINKIRDVINTITKIKDSGALCDEDKVFSSSEVESFERKKFEGLKANGLHNMECTKDSTNFLAEFITSSAIQRAIDELKILYLKEQNRILQETVEGMKPHGNCIERRDAAATKTDSPGTLGKEDYSCDCLIDERHLQGECKLVENEKEPIEFEQQAIAKFIVTQNIAKAVKEIETSEKHAKLKIALEDEICSVVKQLKQKDEELRMYETTIESDVKRIDSIMNELNNAKTTNEELKKVAKSDKGEIKQKKAQIEKLKKKIIDLKNQCLNKRITLQNYDSVIKELKLDVQRLQEKTTAKDTIIKLIKSSLVKANEDMGLLNKDLEMKQRVIEDWESVIASFLCKLSIENAVTSAVACKKQEEKEIEDREQQVAIEALKHANKEDKKRIQNLKEEVDVLRLEALKQRNETAEGLKDLRRVALQIRSLRCNAGLKELPSTAVNTCNIETVIFDLSELEKKIIGSQQEHAVYIEALRSAFGRYIALSVLEQSLQEIENKKILATQNAVKDRDARRSYSVVSVAEQKLVHAKEASRLKEIDAVSKKNITMADTFEEIIKESTVLLVSGEKPSSSITLCEARRKNEKEPASVEIDNSVSWQPISQEAKGIHESDKPENGVPAIVDELITDEPEVILTKREETNLENIGSILSKIFRIVVQVTDEGERSVNLEKNFHSLTGNFLIKCGEEILNTGSLRSSFTSICNQLKILPTNPAVKESHFNKVGKRNLYEECEISMASESADVMSAEAADVECDMDSLLKMVATHTCHASIARGLVELGVDTTDLLPTALQSHVSFQNEANCSNTFLVVTTKDHEGHSMKGAGVKGNLECDPLLRHELITIGSLFLKHEMAKMAGNSERGASGYETATGFEGRQTVRSQSAESWEGYFEKGIGEIREPSAPMAVHAHLMCQNESEISMKSELFSENHFPCREASAPAANASNAKANAIRHDAKNDEDGNVAAPF